MTKDTFLGSQGGGTKKFLYAGPRKRQGFDDEEEATPAFNYNYTSNLRQNPDPKKFDIDGIWGLKDLAVPKLNGKNNGRRGDTESWDLNVGKSYYSRHGKTENAKDQNRNYPIQRKTLETSSQKSFSNVPAQNPQGRVQTWHSHMQTPNTKSDSTFDF